MISAGLFASNWKNPLDLGNIPQVALSNSSCNIYRRRKLQVIACGMCNSNSQVHSTTFKDLVADSAQ